MIKKVLLNKKIKAILLIIITLFLDLWQTHGLIQIPEPYFANIYPWTQITGLTIAIYLGYKNGAFVRLKTSFHLKNIRYLMLFLTLGIILTYIIQKLYIQYVPALEGVAENSEGLTELMNLLPVWFIFPWNIIIGPIFEELVYREYLYRLFNHKILAFFVSVIVFAGVHSGIGYSFFLYLPGSIAMTLAYHRRKIVTDSIIVHSLMNILSIFLI